MHPLIRLSRLELLDNYQEILQNCPIFVLLFLADSLAIKYNSSKHSIEDLVSTIKRVSANQPYLEEDNLEGLARFVNTNCSWDEESLMLAFKDAYNFTPQIPILSSRKFGSKTPENPLSIDEFMTYQICIRYSIPTSRNMTFKDLQYYIYEWSVRATPLRQGIFSKIRGLSRQRLLEIKSIFQNDEDIETFLESIREQDPKKEALNKIARYYRLDASESKVPVEELKNLEKTETDYLPVDPEWREKYLVNPDYYQLNSRYISCYDSLYSSRIKKHLVYLSGYDYTSPKTSSFIVGIHPHIPEKLRGSTLILREPIPECHIERSKRLISSAEHSLIFTREELCDHFDSRKDFTLPTDSSKEFSDSDLNMIIRNSTGHPLVKVIAHVKELRQRNIDETVKALMLFKSEYPIKLLQSLEQLGFIMRGWKTAFGKDCTDSGKYSKDLPVTSSCYSLEHQDAVDDLSRVKILELLQDQKYSFMLSSIPMLILREKDSERVIVPYGGNLTVKDRLNLIVYNPEDEHACIRTSSNMILATAYFFMIRTGISEPIFDISELRCIS
jgi:hypothetical protein